MKAVFEARTQTSARLLPLQGAFAPYFISHACACLPVPAAPPKLPSFNPLWYCAAQPLGTVLHAVKKLGSVVGQSIAVKYEEDGVKIESTFNRSFTVPKDVDTAHLKARFEGACSP